MTIKERIELFNSTWNQEALFLEIGKIYIIKLFETKRRDLEIEDSKEIITNEVVHRIDNPRYLVFDESNIDNLAKYISMDKFTINGKFSKFLKLRDIDSEFISISDEDVQLSYDFIKINVSYFDFYLKNLKFRDLINNKTGAIIKDKFSKNSSNKKPTTQAVLSNLGYIIKESNDEYLELSKQDYTFIKNFVDKMIIEGTYDIKITESLPLYKEDIKKIIEIGKELLNLTNNKVRITKFTKKHFDQTRSSIEGAWQLFFEKYLRIFFMSYKSFYSNIIFKPIQGFEKNSIPDFLAVDLYNNIDIIEIKTHRTPLFRKENGRDSIYPSADLTKSIFQLNKYLDLTSDLIDIKKIDDSYTKDLINNNKIYRPRGILIISSKKHLGASSITDENTIRIEKEIKKLKSTYANIDIVLFDELVESLTRYLEQIEITLKRKGD